MQGLLRRGVVGAYLGVLLATLVWGTLHPVGKVALQEVGPLELVLARAYMSPDCCKKGEILDDYELLGGAYVLKADTVRARYKRMGGVPRHVFASQRDYKKYERAQ